MTAGDENLLRNVTRELLAELLPDVLEQALTAPKQAGNGNGHGAAKWPTVERPSGQPGVPQVPAPPIAAVHRPPGWRPSGGEAPAAAPEPSTQPATQDHVHVPANAAVEQVTIRSDADLDAFVRTLARRLENPRDRMAIVSGRVRFALAGGGAAQAPGAPAETMRVDKGAVTERHVREAHERGARLVLSQRAVLTPMARDRARTLGVEIEKERRC